MLHEVVAREIVDAAYQSASLEQFSGRVLEELRRVAPCDSALFLPSAVTERVVALDRQPTLVGHYRQNWARYKDELARGREAGRRHGAYLDLDVYSFDERQRSAFFNEIIRPQGVKSRVIAQLHFRGEPSATVHLCGPGRGSSGRRALDEVRHLVPLISLAYAAMKTSCDSAGGDELAPLTEHQRRIAKHVAHGYGNKEIAVLLSISPYTVRNELVMIFKRLGVVNRTQLAAIVARAI